MTTSRESWVLSCLLLDPVFDAGARLLGTALDLHPDVTRKLVAQRDDFTRLEQPDPVAQVQARREVLADGERRAADHLAFLDAGLVEAEPLADALGDQARGSALERPRGRGQRILRTA